MKNETSINQQTPPDAKRLLGDVFRSSLNMFLSNDDLRPALKSPFIQNDLVFATDGSIILCFEKSKLNEIDFESHEKAPNALAVIPDGENMNVVFETQHLRNTVTKSKNEVSKRYKVKVTNCPDCDGKCVVDFEYTDYKLKRHEIEHDCPTCDGEGMLEMVTNLANGEADVDGFGEYLFWNDTLFMTDYFDKIVKVAEMFEQKTIRLVQRNSDTSLHKFIVGDCTICLMPVYRSDEWDVITNIA